MTSISNINDEQAWDLVLRAWMTFFIDLRKIRSECASISGGGMDLHSEKRVKVVAQYIWTMGKAIVFAPLSFTEGTILRTTLSQYPVAVM